MFTGIRGIIQMSLNEEQMLSVITRCSEVSGACRCLEWVEVLELAFLSCVLAARSTRQIPFRYHLVLLLSAQTPPSDSTK